MKTLVAFDPSLHSTGIAKFHDNELIDTFTLEVSNKYIGLDAVYRMWEEWQKLHEEHWYGCTYDCIVVEVQKYRTHNERSSVPNLLNLASICTMFYCGVSAKERICAYPDQWKSTTPKHISHERIKKKIPEYTKPLNSDELDAVGLGFYALRKLKW